MIDLGLITAVLNAARASLELGKSVLIKDKAVKDALRQKEVLEALKKTENNGNIFIIQGNNNQILVADWSKIPAAEKKALLENFSNTNKQGLQKEISIIDQEFYHRVELFEASSSSDRKIEKILPFLEPEFKNILKLSIYVKELYDCGNNLEAAEVKSDIGYQYGKNGRRLCNLYSNGYVVAMIEYLSAYHDGNELKIKEDINKRILWLIKKPIFYIHQRHNSALIVAEINEAFHRKEIYIAIHAAGQNISKAESIFSEITERAKECGYDIAVSNEKTLSQTPVHNILITLKD